MPVLVCLVNSRQRLSLSQLNQALVALQANNKVTTFKLGPAK
jgi:hypothetical protein